MVLSLTRRKFLLGCIGLGVLQHNSTGSILTQGIWEDDSTHLIGGVADLNIIRTATFFVAANDAPQSVRAQADYQCDGTADDVQIQAAINSLSSSGGKIILSEGTFNISATLQIVNTRVSIAGSGASTTLMLSALANCDMFQNGSSTQDANRFELAYMQLNGNKSNQSAASNLINVVQNKVGIYIHDLFLKDAYTDCIVLQSAEVAFIEKNIFETPNQYGINITGDDLKLAIWIKNNEYDTVPTCIYVAAGGAGVVHRNLQVLNNTALYSTGRFLYLGGTRRFADVTVVGNHATDFTGSTADLIYEDNADWANASRIVSNNVYNGYGSTNGNAVYAQANAIVTNNNLANIPANGVTVGSGSIVRNNLGYVTENSGTGTINNGATTAVITHGGGFTPTAGDISITWTENPTNDPGNWWISSITSTQFTVNVRNDPGASNLDFTWAIRRV